MRARAATTLGALVLVLGGCGALFGIGELPPLSTTNADAGKLHDDGASVGEDRDGGTIDGSNESGSPDPRWAQWPMGPDVPVESDFSFESGTDGATIADKRTGLIWQDSITSGPVQWSAAEEVCANLVYDGKDDWRWPTRIEMVSIASVGPSGFEPQPAFFSPATGVLTPCFWTASATMSGASDDDAWQMANGVKRASGVYTCHVRCVRGGPPVGAHEKQRYTTDASTVRDLGTGLVWERLPPTDKVVASDSAARCGALSLAGKPARLPSIKELLSIVDDTAISPAADSVFGSGTGAAFSANAWSSTRASSGFWFVGFLYGETDTSGNGASDHNASRCVVAP